MPAISGIKGHWTYPYEAPECRNVKDIIPTKSADWYSLGALLYTLHEGQAPFYGKNHQSPAQLTWPSLRNKAVRTASVMAATEGNSGSEEPSPENFGDFVQKLMAYKAASRLGTRDVVDVMQHSFFECINGKTDGWEDLSSGTRNGKTDRRKDLSAGTRNGKTDRREDLSSGTRNDKTDGWQILSSGDPKKIMELCAKGCCDPY